MLGLPGRQQAGQGCTFPRTGRAHEQIADASRGGYLLHRHRLVGAQGIGPARQRLLAGSGHRRVADHRPGAVPAGVEQAGLGPEQFGRAVLPCRGGGELAGAVGGAEEHRDVGQLGWGKLDGQAQGRLDGALGDLGALARCEEHAVQLALHVGVEVGLGKDRGLLRAGIKGGPGHVGDHGVGQVVGPQGGQVRAPGQAGHPRGGLVAHPGPGPFAPLSGHLGHRAVSFLLPCFPPCCPVDNSELVTGRSPVPGRLELGRLCGDGRLDGQGAAGELGHQVGGHAVDFALSHPAGDGPGLGPRHPETRRHEVLDQADMALGQGHHEGVQCPAVERAPHPVRNCLGTVPNDAVVMELSITISALEVQPGTGDHAPDRFLASTLGAGAGEKDVVLGPGDDLTERLRHDLFDASPGGLVPHGPHQRNRFWRVKCEVVAGHRRPLAGRGEPAEGLAGEGVGQLGQHPVEHLGGDHVARLH